jgi:hypothetical protein
MASVALDFILEIDELLFEKFAGQWRIVQIKKVSFQDPNTLKENSEVSSAKKMRLLFWRDLLLAVMFAFGVVFGIRIQLLHCPSWSDTPPVRLNASEISNTSSNPISPQVSAQAIEIEVCLFQAERRPMIFPTLDHRHLPCRSGQQVLRQHDEHRSAVFRLLRDGVPHLLLASAQGGSERARPPFHVHLGNSTVLTASSGSAERRRDPRESAAEPPHRARAAESHGRGP